MKYLGRVLESKWFIIGQELGVDKTKLCQISATTKDWEAYDRLDKVFKAWEAKPRPDKPYQWETVIDILKLPNLNAEHLAVKIEMLLCKK